MAFGPLWFVRAGVVVSVLAAFVAVLFAWREIDRVNRAHRVELKSVLAAGVEQANNHHRDSLDMLDRFDARAQQLTGTIARLTSELAAAHGELATMRGNNVWLRGEVAERQAHIDELAARVAELEAARDQAANLLNLPRYGVASGRPLPTAEELWADGNHPTIVDLNRLAFPDVDRIDQRQTSAG